MRDLCAASLLTGLLLIGCGPASKPLTVAINAGVEGTALKLAAREWAAARSVPVEIVELPYANLFEKEMIDLTSRTGAYDVLMMDDPWFPALAQNESLTPLPGTPDPDFLESCLSVCRHPDKTGTFYAVPYVGNSQLFFYRKDLFAKYGLDPPTTWSRVLEAARRIGPAERMYGYVMRAAPGNPAVADFMPLLWAFGGDLFDENGRVALSRPEAIDALRFMLELGRYAPPGYAGFNADEVSAHLLQSTAAMSINWPAWISAMDDPAKSKVPNAVEFTSVPGEKRPGQAELGTWLLGVPAASKLKQQAFEFIFWASSREPMKQAVARGNPPTRRSIFEDPELLKTHRAFPAQLASLASARPRPRTPFWNEIENVFGVCLSQANAGTLSPEEAMRRAEHEIAYILERAR
jgi:multiple sugar transport system substrate-binding protein